MPRLWLVRAVVAAVCSLVAVAASAPMPSAAAAPEALDYRPPVEAELVDPFRPPPHRFGPGNRGVEYATEPGTPVVAAERGVVAFAGRVGGSLHVTVLHPDGVRTTYSFLRSVGVRRGERVHRGQEVGRAGDTLHFGARVGDEYVDPRSLSSGGRARARLVPDHEVKPASRATEQALLRDLLRRIGRAATKGITATASFTAAAAKEQVADLARRYREVADWLAVVGELSPAGWVEVAAELAASHDDGRCTPAERAPPPPSGRRLLVLVGGLGSSSASAGVDALDTRALGYADADVSRFSYRGGTVAERPYRARDTAGDLAHAGERLHELLRRLADEHPGVPVDVVAHSQGGLVARAALARARAPTEVQTLVTLGTPHQGADVAGSLLVARGNPSARGGEDLLRALRVTEIDGEAPALRQLAPGSPFLRDLARRRLPSHVRVTSVAARADVVVASPRSRLPGARNVVVTVEGVHDHSALPRSAAAQREVALAVAGLPPTCRSRADAAVDALVARVVLQEQRLAGSALRLGWRPGTARLPASS